ncbi:hypothetical protein Hte_001908 [Hypoxylon texense]
MDSSDLDNTPLVPPPPGRTPNFTNPESRCYQLIIPIAVYTALIVILISLRIYSRLRITRSFGADDWLCIVATVLTLSYSALVLKQYQKGSLADSVLIRITNTTIKVAFLVFYLRLFSPVKYVRHMIWVGMAVVITFCVVFVVIDLVACAPWPSEHGDWLAPSLLDRCDRIVVDLITAGAYFSVITDFYILFIPLHQIPKLGLSRKRKIGITLIFLTGFLATCSGIVNIIFRSNRKVFDRSDFTWTIVPVYATSLTEINVGLLCHSMPVVFILFVGRFSNLSKSVGSWVRERRSPRQTPHQSAGESSTNLAADGGAPRHISPIPSDPSFSGMRKFIRNMYRSKAQSSAHGDTTFATFEDLTSADLSYHVQLKAVQSKQTGKSREAINA